MSDRPKDGRYLDAALAVVGEQLEERIDQLSRRRRARHRFGVAVLALTTVASGSVAAVALSNPGLDAAGPTSATLDVSAELRCIDGYDPSRPAYFTVSYRIADDAGLDRERACAAARTMLAADEGDIASVTPAELVARAHGLLGEAMVAGGTVDGGGSAVAVDEASFGRLSRVGGTSMVACGDETASIVLATSLGEAPTALERSALCAPATGANQ